MSLLESPDTTADGRMIVSHTHRFIFIKTRKTAGTSIELALSDIAGEDAIVTPLIPREPGHTPRNYKGERRDMLRWAIANPDGRARALSCLLREPGVSNRRNYYNHMPAWLVRAKLGETMWRGYYKFCCERNPWEKTVSLYWWAIRDEAVVPPFEDWVLTDDRVVSDWPLYTLDGHIAVDDVVQYDELDAGLARVCKHLGVRDLELPRAKRAGRGGEVLYTSRAAEHVRSVFHREIEAFGYECHPELLA